MHRSVSCIEACIAACIGARPRAVGERERPTGRALTPAVLAVPQNLDDEYLITWDGFPGTLKFRYLSEKELRKFLIDRVRDGYML